MIFLINLHAQKQGYTEAQKNTKMMDYYIQKMAFRNVFFFKKNLPTFQNFSVRPYKPSVAVAIAEGAKLSATAVEIWPSVDL